MVVAFFMYCAACMLSMACVFYRCARDGRYAGTPPYALVLAYLICTLTAPMTVPVIAVVLLFDRKASQ